MKNCGGEMKRRYLQNSAYTLILIIINLLANILLVIFVVYAIRENANYYYDFTWMILFSACFFGVIFNAHFAFLGVFSRIIIQEDNIIIKKLLRITTLIELKNVKKIYLSKEMRYFFKTIDKKIILIEGYDAIKKTNTIVKLDFRESLYNFIVEAVNEAARKKIKSMDWYFDKQPM